MKRRPGCKKRVVARRCIFSGGGGRLWSRLPTAPASDNAADKPAQRALAWHARCVMLSMAPHTALLKPRVVVRWQVAAAAAAPAAAPVAGGFPDPQHVHGVGSHAPGNACTGHEHGFKPAWRPIAALFSSPGSRSRRRLSFRPPRRSRPLISLVSVSPDPPHV